MAALRAESAAGRAENAVLRRQIEAVESRDRRWTARRLLYKEMISVGIPEFREGLPLMRLPSLSSDLRLDVFRPPERPPASDTAPPPWARVPLMRALPDPESVEKKKAAGLESLMSIPALKWLPLGPPILPGSEAFPHGVFPPAVREEANRIRTRISFMLMEWRGIEGARTALGRSRPSNPDGTLGHLHPAVKDAAALLEAVLTNLDADVLSFVEKLRDLLEPHVRWIGLQTWSTRMLAARKVALEAEDWASLRSLPDSARLPWSAEEVAQRVASLEAEKKEKKLLSRSGAPSAQPASSRSREEGRPGRKHGRHAGHGRHAQSGAPASFRPADARPSATRPAAPRSADHAAPHPAPSPAARAAPGSAARRPAGKPSAGHGAAVKR